MVCCVALGAAGQVDPQLAVALQEDRGSLRRSGKDAEKITECDPGEEEEHYNRTSSDECLLCTTSTLTTEHTS